MTYNALAIILRREAYRETARIYTVYTREHGKLLAVGRGTRKLLSKLGPHLEPYSLAELHLANGRKFETLCGAVMRRSPEPLIVDETRHAAAAFVAEAFDHFVKWGERDERLWSLLDAAFSDIQDCPPGHVPHQVGTFVWSFMGALGYRPRLESCAACEGELRTAAVFLPARGIALCADCRPGERLLVDAEPVDGEILAEIRQFLDRGHVDLVPVSPAALRSGLAFIEAHLDRPLMSLPVIREALMPTRKGATVPA